MDFDFLQGYEPEAIVDTDGNYEPLKGTYVCQVNKAIYQDYEGKADYQGKIVETEVEIVDGDKTGRRAWKTFYLNSDRQNGKGKTDAHVLTDWLFTLGLTYSTEEEFEKCLEEFTAKTIKCFFFHYTTEGSNKPKQSYSLKSESVKPEKSEAGVPF